MTGRGMFVVVEGPDGVGKSTQVERLTEYSYTEEERAHEQSRVTPLPALGTGRGNTHAKGTTMNDQFSFHVDTSRHGLMVGSVALLVFGLSIIAALLLWKHITWRQDRADRSAINDLYNQETISWDDVYRYQNTVARRRLRHDRISACAGFAAATALLVAVTLAFWPLRADNPGSQQYQQSLRSALTQHYPNNPVLPGAGNLDPAHIMMRGNDGRPLECAFQTTNISMPRRTRATITGRLTCVVDASTNLTPRP